MHEVTGRSENNRSKRERPPGFFSMFYEEVDDVLATADYLAKLPGADLGHIYLAGHSAGGTLTMLATLTDL